jgi:hypothetical protein
MTELQRTAFNLAAKTLDRDSRFYADDLDSLRRLYSRKTDAECREAIGRFESRVSQAEIRLHSQL